MVPRWAGGPIASGICLADQAPGPAAIPLGGSRGCEAGPPCPLASVSAPVRGQGGKVIAAASVSGPIERLTRSPGRLHAAAVVAAGDKIGASLRGNISPVRG